MVWSLRIRFLTAFVGLLLVAPAFASPHTPADPLPGDSLYRLKLTLVDQHAWISQLSDLRGGPVLIAMFYTSCKYVCPLIIDTLMSTERALGDGNRAHLRVLLVSFDPEHDTPQALKIVVDKRHLDGTRWTLARTDAAGVRKLAAALGVQYRAIANGDFNHSSVITLLDGEGRIVARSSRIGESDPDFVAAAERTLSGAQ